jgi:hypothetical protein
MNSKKPFETFNIFYLVGLIFILIGLIIINLDFNYLDYSLIGIGILLVVLGLNETIKSI